MQKSHQQSCNPLCPILFDEAFDFELNSSFWNAIFNRQFRQAVREVAEISRSLLEPVGNCAKEKKNENRSSFHVFREKSQAGYFCLNNLLNIYFSGFIFVHYSEAWWNFQMANAHVFFIPTNEGISND